MIYKGVMLLWGGHKTPIRPHKSWFLMIVNSYGVLWGSYAPPIRM